MIGEMIVASTAIANHLVNLNDFFVFSWRLRGILLPLSP